MSLRSNVAETEGGRLAGAYSPDQAVLAFKGVPYARPPVGDLRWRAPQPAEPWPGVRAANAFGPRSIQRDRPATSISYFGPEPQSEDCLYLNVWTGAQSEAERRPVMVWFHGGGFVVGSGSLPIFDGDTFARLGIVLVTINYRLGPLGFLAHPELRRESEHGSSGNYGLLDQIAALRWIKANIAAFGGDPARVTIFGQSVGSSSVACLMASPLARGLMHRAIGQSGGSFAPTGRPGGGSLQTLDEAEQCGLAVADVLGVRSLRELRAIAADDIQLKVPDNRLTRSWPSIDGYVIPEPPHDIFLKGRQNDVPLLTGSNANEGSIRPAPTTVAELYKKATDEFGATADDLVDVYLKDGSSVEDASRLLGGHKSFNSQNWAWARLQARTGTAPVYYYHFSHLCPIAKDRAWFENSADKLRAFHTAEIPYVYGSLKARDWAWRESDRALAKLMSSYWANFAANGNPNGDGLPAWPAFDPRHPQAMRFHDGAAMGPVPDHDKLKCFDAFYARQSPAHAWTLEEQPAAAE